MHNWIELILWGSNLAQVFQVLGYWRILIKDRIIKVNLRHQFYALEISTLILWDLWKILDFNSSPELHRQRGGKKFYSSNFLFNQVDSSKKGNPSKTQEKPSASSRSSRFGFGSQIFQKTLGLVIKSRTDKQVFNFVFIFYNLNEGISYFA